MFTLKARKLFMILLALLLLVLPACAGETPTDAAAAQTATAQTALAQAAATQTAQAEAAAATQTAQAEAAAAEAVQAATAQAEAAQTATAQAEAVQAEAAVAATQTAQAEAAVAATQTAQAEATATQTAQAEAAEAAATQTAQAEAAEAAATQTAQAEAAEAAATQTAQAEAATTQTALAQAAAAEAVQAATAQAEAAQTATAQAEAAQAEAAVAATQTAQAEAAVAATQTAQAEAAEAAATQTAQAEAAEAAATQTALAQAEAAEAAATQTALAQAEAAEAAATQTALAEAATTQTALAQAAATQTALAQAAATQTALAEAAATQTAQAAATQTAQAEAPTLNLIETLQAEGSFSILIKALETMGLTDMQEITLFAPTDKAFDRLPPETLQNLFDNPDVLKETLLYHVVEEPMGQDKLIEQTAPTHENGTPIHKLRTIQGDTVTIADFGERLKVNNATIMQPDIETSDGSIIHGIDIVLQSVSFTEPPPPDGLIESIEVWQPYQEGKPLPIGDAELVPGAQEMRIGVRVLADVLKINDVLINTARTVVLEEQGEIVYLAPIASQWDQADIEELGQMIIGVMVIEGETKLPAGVGPYAVQLSLRTVNDDNNQPQISLLNEEGKPIEIPGPDGEPVLSIEQVLVMEELEQSEFPSAALFYGSRYCRSGNDCWRCSFFDWLWYDSYPTPEQCQDRLQ